MSSKPGTTKTAPKPRTCREFLEEWLPRIRNSGEPIELDYSFSDDAISVTDMRIPSALRTGVLYRRHEVEDNVDRVRGDFDKRVKDFLAKGLKA